MAQASGYVYIFGSRTAATDGWTGHDVYVARVRLGDLGMVTRWRFFASGSWTHVQAAATPILRSSVNGGTETVFSLWRTPSGWKITSKRGGQWGPGQIVRWTTPNLGAAWTETVLGSESAQTTVDIVVHPRMVIVMNLPEFADNAYTARHAPSS